jgi:hypothetical protein
MPGTGLSSNAGGGDPYGYTAGFSHRDWAWEFLRRNPAFGAALSGFSRHVRSRVLSRNVTVHEVTGRVPRLADWGVIFRLVGV